MLITDDVPQVVLDNLHTIQWPVRIEDQVEHWCQGCDDTHQRHLMNWTEIGLWRCRECRIIT